MITGDLLERGSATISLENDKIAQEIKKAPLLEDTPEEDFELGERRWATDLPLMVFQGECARKLDCFILYTYNCGCINLTLSIDNTSLSQSYDKLRQFGMSKCWVSKDQTQQLTQPTKDGL